MTSSIVCRDKAVQPVDNSSKLQYCQLSMVRVQNGKFGISIVFVDTLFTKLLLPISGRRGGGAYMNLKKGVSYRSRQELSITLESKAVIEQII